MFKDAAEECHARIAAGEVSNNFATKEWMELLTLAFAVIDSDKSREVSFVELDQAIREYGPRNWSAKYGLEAQFACFVPKGKSQSIQNVRISQKVWCASLQALKGNEALKELFVYMLTKNWWFNDLDTAFEYIDTDGSGKLSFGELEAAVKAADPSWEERHGSLAAALKGMK